MARPARIEQSWFGKVAEIMVREQKNIQQAAMECDVDLTSEELRALEKRKAFQQVLWTERHRFFQELASDPNRSKTSLLGQMLFLTQKLIEEGEYDKALEGLMKLAKIEGFVGPEQQVNIFGGLSPKDLEEAKKRLNERLGQGTAATQGLGQA